MLADSLALLQRLHPTRKRTLFERLAAPEQVSLFLGCLNKFLCFWGAFVRSPRALLECTWATGVHFVFWNVS